MKKKILYTNQPLNFDIVKDKVDLSLSECYTDKDFVYFKKAYDYLYDLIGSRDWIWCNGIVRYNLPVKEPVKVWELEVPVNKIICINTDIWNCAINDRSYNFEIWDFVLHTKFKDKDGEYKFIDDFEELVKKHVDVYDTYGGLVVKERDKWDDKNCEYLIPSPIKKSWVVNTTIAIPNKDH